MIRLLLAAVLAAGLWTAPALAVQTATTNHCKNTASTSTAGILCTMPGTTTTGNSIVCGFYWNSATEATAASITDAGTNTYALRPTTYGTNDGSSAKIGDALTITGKASHVLTLNFSPNVTDAAIACQEFTNTAAGGFDQGSKNAVDGAGTSTDAITSGGTSTRAQANELLVGFVVSVNNSQTYAHGTGYTDSEVIATYGSLEWKVVTATGTDAATWTASAGSNNYIAAIATYKDVVAGGGGGAATGQRNRAPVDF